MHKVDVIIPTYKRPTFLARAVNSVLSQTYKEINVVVVDDNTEGDEFRKETEKLMARFSGNDKVIYLKHEKNKNGAAARNTGIKYSTAEFIAFLDDDDFFLPNKIKNQLKILDNTNSSWGGVCCNHVRRYKNYAYSAFEVKPNSSGNYCYEFLSGVTSLPSSTLVIKKGVFQEIGYFDESFQRHQDLEFLVRFFRKFKMAVSPHFHLYMQIEGFRNYPESKKAHMIKTKFLRKYQRDIFSFNDEEQENINRHQWFDIACLYLKDRHFSTAVHIFRKDVFRGKSIRVKDLLKIFFFLLSGFVPLLKKLTAVLLGSTIFRSHSGERIFR